MNEQIEKIRQALINAMAGEVQPKEIREGLEALARYMVKEPKSPKGDNGKPRKLWNCRKELFKWKTR